MIETQERKKKEVKEVQHEKLGLFVNPNALAHHLNNKMNPEQNKISDEIDKKILELKKSTEYKKSQLAFKMLKKTRALIELYKKPESEVRNKNIEELLKSLREGGSFQPIFKEEGVTKDGKAKKVMTKERFCELKYSDIEPIPDSLEGFEKLREVLQGKFHDVFTVFEERDNNVRNSVKFNNSVKVAIVYMLQETLIDIVKIALKNFPGNTGKLDLIHFNPIFFMESNFLPLFHNTPVMDALRKLISLKAEHDKIQESLRSTTDCGITIPFDELARKKKMLKFVTKKGLKNNKPKKVWEGLTPEKKFTSFVTKIYDHTSSKLGKSKVVITSRARELLSEFIDQILQRVHIKMNNFLNHKVKLVEIEKNKKVDTEKMFSYDDVTQMFDTLLFNEQTPMVPVFQTLFSLRKKMREAKKPKSEIVN